MATARSVSHADLVRHAGDLIQSGREREAEALLKDILRADPSQPDALIALGVLAGMRGQLAEAVKHLRRASKAAPRSDAAHYNLGQALIRMGRHADAVTALQAAAKLADLPHIHEKLGDALRQLGRLDEAARHFVRATELDAGNSLALSSAVEMLRKTCDWPRLAALEQRLVSLAGAGQPVEPLVAMHVSDDPALQQRVAQTYWRALVQPSGAAKQPIAAPRRRPPGGKLRLGYLSADFRLHPMVSVIAEVIELHDRSRFEVIGYSYGLDDGSPERRRMAKAFDRFNDVRTLSDIEIARRIADHGIDILVDLAGYTANARLGVVAARPAAIMCHYMGFPGTLGSPAYDYLIADRYVAPDEEASHFSEALARLPGCYWAVDRKRTANPVPVTRSDFGLAEDAVVLSSFNGQQKLSPALLDVWARVLAAVPAAVLWLYSDSAVAADNLRREAAARGIAADRLVMAGRVPPARHMARIALADLMLDTLPYGGHTTVCDALWMGVPALTVAGRAFAARVGASLLSAVGLPELIMPSLEAYEREAVALAGDRARLAAMTGRLAEVRASAPLFDTPQFTRDLEAAFGQMHARCLRGERPASFVSSCQQAGVICT